MSQSIYPALRYRNAKAAIAWLKSALGFKERVVYENDDGSVGHAELSLAGNLIMLGSEKEGDAFGRSPVDGGRVTATIYIAFHGPHDVDAMFERARRAGAQVVRELSDTDYGSHEFAIRDLEGQIWSFGTYRPQAGD